MHQDDWRDLPRWHSCATCDVVWRARKGTPCWVCGQPANITSVMAVTPCNIEPDSALGVNPHVQDDVLPVAAGG